MTTRKIRNTLLLTIGSVLLATSAARAAMPAPCQVIPAQEWSGIMGYTATATPGDGLCTYEGAPKTGGGQFRILATVGTSAEAAASAKRMQDHQAHGGHNANLSAVDSQGVVVFSIALFQKEATDATAAQLRKLVAAAKQHLPK